MINSHIFCVLLFLLICLDQSVGEQFEVDEQGYIVYCPCMGKYFYNRNPYIRYNFHLNTALD